jgi:hypothetical protein
MANDTLSDKPDKNEKKLEKAVEDMFKHFPPSSIRLGCGYQDSSSERGV